MKHTEHNNEADPIALKIADIPVRNTLPPSFHPTELNPEQPLQHLHIPSSYPPALPFNSFHLLPPSPFILQSFHSLLLHFFTSTSPFLLFYSFTFLPFNRVFLQFSSHDNERLLDMIFHRVDRNTQFAGYLRIRHVVESTHHKHATRL